MHQILSHKYMKICLSVLSCCFVGIVAGTEVCRPNGEFSAIQQCMNAGGPVGADNNHTVKADECNALAEIVKTATNFTYTCSFVSYRHYYTPEHYGGGEFCELTLSKDENSNDMREKKDCFMLSLAECRSVNFCQIYDL